MLTVSLVNQADEIIADLDWSTVTARRELFAEAGWEVVAPGDVEVFRLIRDRAEPYWVLLTDHSTGEVDGGPVRSIRWRGSESDGTMVLSGPDANWYCNTFLVLPVHTQTNYPGSPARVQRGYTLGQMHGSTAIYQMVDDQAKNTTLPYRNLDLSLLLASLVNTGFEATGYEAEPFELPLDTIRRWGLDTGVIADFRWRGASTTAELVTRLPTVRGFRMWEQDGWVLDWEYTEDADRVNYLWVGGKGEGVERQVFPVAPADPIPPEWGITIERFLDAGSSDASVDGVQLAQVTIAGQAAETGVAAGSTAAPGVEFGADYLLGDIVPAVFLGVEYFRVVTAVEREWGAAGKTERIETGVPPLAIYNQPGVTLGEQPAVTYQPTSGLAIGELSLREHWDPADINVALDIEIVYAAIENLQPADKPYLTLEVRVDGGSWQPVSAGPTSFRVDNGGADAHYLTVAATDSTPSLSGFTTSLEYRAFLTQTGEPTVFTPVLVLGDLAAAPGAPTGFAAALRLAGDNYAADLSWATPVEAGAPPADSVDIRYRLVGAPTWSTASAATNPAVGSTSIGHAYTGGDEFEYQIRFVSALFDGPWSSSSTLTYPDAPSAPGQPSGFTAVQQGTSLAVSVDWDQPLSAPGVPAADRFRFRYREVGAPTWIETSYLVADPSTVSSAGLGGITGADYGDTFEFAMQVSNGSEESPWSDADEVTFVNTGAFTTSDGGYFTTSDGGYFTTGS